MKERNNNKKLRERTKSRKVEAGMFDGWK